MDGNGRWAQACGLPRTGGEWRLSNFLLWRASEAVFVSTPVLWPDFQQDHLQEIIQVYVEQISEQESES